MTGHRSISLAVKSQRKRDNETPPRSFESCLLKGRRAAAQNDSTLR